jgi:hypothetical protein
MKERIVAHVDVTLEDDFGIQLAYGIRNGRVVVVAEMVAYKISCGCIL